MRTVVTALLAIVIVLIAIVAVYGATESILTSGIHDLGVFSDGILGCLTGNECGIFDNGGD